MSKATGFSLLTTGVLLCGALLTVVPTASAQIPEPTFDFQITGVPTGPLIPYEQVAAISFDYVYTIKGTVLQGNLASFTGAATVSFTVQCTPNQVFMTGSTDGLIAISSSSTTDVYEGSVRITITPTRDAPGLEPISCVVEGSVGPVGGTAIPASNTKTNSFGLTPDFFSLIEASVPVKLRKSGPDKQVNYAIDITNFGNSQTRVTFETLEAPGGKWDGLLPDPLILDPKGGERATVQANFQVSTAYKNGWNNEKESFTIVMKPEYSLNAEKKGPETQLQIITRVRGVYIPALEPFVMVAAVLGSAFLARLRSEEE